MKNIYGSDLYEVRKIKDLKDMLEQSRKLYGDQTAFKIKDRRAAGLSYELKNNKTVKRADEYVGITYEKYAYDVDAFGTYLMQGNPEGNLKVAILAESRYEWYVSYLAVTNGAGIVVPLDMELPQNELVNLIQRSQADVLIYSQARSSKLEAMRDDLKDLKSIICMDDLEAGDVFFWQALKEGRSLLAEGDKSFVNASIDPHELRILLFTSGTTAKSKAVMLSHHNICVNLEAMCSMVYIDDKDTFLSVLPLHHTYECTCGFLCPIYRGSTIAVCDGLRYIAQNMRESKVTIVLLVPLMLEAFYKKIQKNLKDNPQLKKKFDFGLKLTKALLKVGIDLRKKVFGKVHANFGGHLRLLIAGGAAIDADYLSGMQDLGIHCLQGYGLTECAPILALNRDKLYNNESAGLPMPGCEIRIIDKDDEGIGEIIGRGENLMLGYYQDPELTQEVIDSEGFYHTGDLGYLDGNFLIITGRKANMIVSKNGKNIFPEELEFLLNQNELIAESLVFAEENEAGDKLIMAEVLVSQDYLNSQPELAGEALDSAKLKELVASWIKECNAQVQMYKRIKGFKLRTTEFEKTTSRKIKRKR